MNRRFFLGMGVAAAAAVPFGLLTLEQRAAAASMDWSAMGIPPLAFRYAPEERAFRVYNFTDDEQLVRGTILLRERDGDPCAFELVDEDGVQIPSLPDCDAASMAAYQLALRI